MHISLDAALQRQPLLSTVGDKLLPTFPGAAAAYSLRALNGDANNAVRVRRDADNAELDFTAEGVSFELENWVNGKLEDTLPADVDTAAAAYSLRKVRDAYTGNAVQIRRASDDVEVNVAFDANGEVSASSAITNIPVGNFPTSVAQNRTGAARYGTFTTDGLYSFSAIANAVALGGYVIDEGSVGDVVTVSFDLTLNSGSISSIVLRPALETGSDVSNLSGPISSSGSYSFDLTATDAYSVVAFIAVSANFTVSNVSIQVRQDAGDTTATTLGGFLTPQWKNVGYASFTKDEDWENGFTAFNSGGSVAALRLPSGNAGDSITISFDLTFNSGTPSPAFSLRDEAAGSIRSNAVFATTEGSGSATLIATGSYEFISISEFDVPSGFSLSNITLSVVPVGADAHVVTWYDQSGNGYDATQDTAGDQPKIAEAGSLVTKLGKTSIDFTTDSTFLANLDFSITETESAVFAVWQPAKDDASIGSEARNRALYSNHGGSIFISTPNSNNQIGFRRFGTVQNFTLAFSNLKTINAHAFVGTSSGANYYFNGSSIYSDSLTGTNATRNDLYIGTKQNVIGHDTEGYISEFIFYNSDQSSNFFKIQSNINNHYGIYTAAHNGFVETWYDQSGNGNHASQSYTPDQPKIVSAGSLLADGIDFDGVDDHFDLNNVLTGTDGVSSFFVGNADSTSISEAMFCQGNLSGASGSAYSVSSEIAVRVSGSVVFDDDFIDANTLLLSVITPDAGTTTDAVARLNGTQLSQTSSTGTTLNYTNQDASIGRRFASTAAYDGSLKELIIYHSDQSANRSAIESNIADEYGITLS